MADTPLRRPLLPGPVGGRVSGVRLYINIKILIINFFNHYHVKKEHARDSFLNHSSFLLDQGQDTLYRCFYQEKLLKKQIAYLLSYDHSF